MLELLQDHLIDDKQRKIRKATLWMLRQDLSAYVLLGDPAARLNIEGPLAHQTNRATVEQIHARPPPRVMDTIREMPAVAMPEIEKPTVPYIALSPLAIEALADRFSMERTDLEQLLAELPRTSFLASGGENIFADESAEIEEAASFADDDPLPWQAYIGDSGKVEAGKTVPDTLLAEIKATREAIPREDKINQHGKGHMYTGLADKAHTAYIRDYLHRKMAVVDAPDKRKIAAFLAFQAREGSTAAINTYDNQIVTWGTGWGGLGWLGNVMSRVTADDKVRGFFGKCGVRYRGKNTYDVVDLKTRQVVTGKKEALEVIRGSLPLIFMLIHAARAPEMRDAIIEAQLRTFFISAADIGRADAIATQALHNMVAPLRHWAPARMTIILTLRQDIS